MIKLDHRNMTFAQKSMIGSGGCAPQGASLWDISSVLTPGFPLCEMEKTIQTAAEPRRALNAMIEFGVWG